MSLGQLNRFDPFETQSARDFTVFSGPEAFNTLGFAENTTGRAGTSEYAQMKKEEEEAKKKDKDDGYDTIMEAIIERQQRTLANIEEQNARLRAAGLDITVEDVKRMTALINDPNGKSKAMDAMTKKGMSQDDAAIAWALIQKANKIDHKIMEGTATPEEIERRQQIDKDDRYITGTDTILKNSLEDYEYVSLGSNSNDVQLEIVREANEIDQKIIQGTATPEEIGRRQEITYNPAYQQASNELSSSFASEIDFEDGLEVTSVDLFAEAGSGGDPVADAGNNDPFLPATPTATNNNSLGLG